MKVTIFAKRIKKHDGTSFTGYVTKLTRKDGSEQYARVRFNQDVQLPREFPAVIIIPAGKANLQQQDLTKDDGTTYTRYTLWVSGWDPSGEKFVDHSLDDFQ